MAINENLRAMIRELLEDELKEVSASGAAGPYMTPKAFGKKKPASGVSQQEEPHEFGGTNTLGESRIKLSELTPKTLDSYEDKASKSRDKEQKSAAKHAKKGDDLADAGTKAAHYKRPAAKTYFKKSKEEWDKEDKATKTANKRDKGLKAAADKQKKTGTWTTAGGRKAHRDPDGNISYEDK